MSAEVRLAAAGIVLPEVPRPVPSFVPWRRHGSLVFLAAQNCVWNGRVAYEGKLGRDVPWEAGPEAARLCGLNLIAALREALDGDLDRVRACLRLGCFLNVPPGPLPGAALVGGAVGLLEDVFGRERTRCVPTTIGVVQLPQNASVAMDAVFEVDGAGHGDPSAPRAA